MICPDMAERVAGITRETFLCEADDLILLRSQNEGEHLVSISRSESFRQALATGIVGIRSFVQHLLFEFEVFAFAQWHADDQAAFLHEEEVVFLLTGIDQEGGGFGGRSVFRLFFSRFDFCSLLLDAVNNLPPDYFVCDCKEAREFLDCECLRSAEALSLVQIETEVG